MKAKYIIIALFSLLMMVQFYVPLSMIVSNEEVLEEGETLLFRTRPIDPFDPFRGKYVTLSYTDDRISSSDTTWERFDEVYVTFKKDTNGYSYPDSLYRNVPNEQTYLKTTVKRAYHSYKREGLKVYLTYPFTRLYMNENKALEAEKAFNEANRSNRRNWWGRRDTTNQKEAYGAVKIKDGKAVLENVYIDGVTLKEVAEKRIEEIKMQEQAPDSLDF